MKIFYSFLLVGLCSISSMAQIQLGSDIDGENPQDYSGNSVSLSADGTILAVGATGNDGNGDRAGHVRVYQNNSGVWSQLGSDIDGEDSLDVSGHSVSLSDDGMILAIVPSHRNKALD